MEPLIDNHGRPIHYLRLAVTDRCNLRCFYCMPAEGIQYLPKKELLTYEEIERLIGILTPMGISKIRLTGGEPFVRTDLLLLIEKIAQTPGIQEWHLTTNGILTEPFIPTLKKFGISSINLSLDTLDKDRFFAITRRNNFEKVLSTFHALLDHQIPVKINAVVMEGKNIEDLIPLAQLTRDHPVSVRFIEEMPFNGKGNHYARLHWDHLKIESYLKQHFPSLEKIQDAPYSTSKNFSIADHAGKIGIIPAFSRTFCGTCNRIRITAQGNLKTCLYDDGVLDLKALLRSGETDEQIQSILLKAIGSRAKDGFEAEKNRKNQTPVSESMSTIGG